MRTTVSSKGQVTIPAALRERLGIEKGTVLELREEGGRIILKKADVDDAVAAVFGLLADGRTSEALMATLRPDLEQP